MGISNNIDALIQIANEQPVIRHFSGSGGGMTSFFRHPVFWIITNRTSVAVLSDISWKSFIHGNSLTI